MIEIVLVSLSVLVLLLALAQIQQVREFVISSKHYKKGFALHMNIFSQMHNRAVHIWKENLFSGLKDTLEASGALGTPPGDILEIGTGTGANFQFFPEGSSVVALDPNPHMERYLRSNADKFSHIHLKKVVTGFAEDMKEIEDNSVAAVVCTLTLCSVQDMDAVMSEVKRVLRPGGCFYFLEHVADEPGTWRYTLQRVLDGTWKYLSDGCSCHQETWKYIDKAGFTSVAYERRCANELTAMAYIMRPHLLGFAIK